MRVPASLWRPALAGGSAFGLTFLVHMLVTMAWGPPAGLLGLVLLPACWQEVAKLLFLRLAGGPAHWPQLGVAFGLCHALLQLVRPDAPLAVAAAAAAAAILLPLALGRVAAGVARRSGRRLFGFAAALLLHALVALATSTAALALARQHGLPLGSAAAYAGLTLALVLALVTGPFYSAASRAASPLAGSPKASASRR